MLNEFSVLYLVFRISFENFAEEPRISARYFKRVKRGNEQGQTYGDSEYETEAKSREFMSFFLLVHADYDVKNKYREQRKE